MLFKSTLLAQASGSVAGATFSRNKGGMYIRSRSLVVTPKTPQQQQAQDSIKTLSARWRDLSDAQRANWKTYAVNSPVLNRVGEERIIPELAMYVRCNAPRLTFLGIADVIDDAPTLFGLAVLSTPTFTAVHTTGLHVTYDNTDDWATADGGYLFVQSSRPVSPTIIYPKTNYRFAGDVAGSTMTPPTPPAVIAPAFPFVAGQRIYCRFRASNADGRLSSDQVLSVLAT